MCGTISERIVARLRPSERCGPRRTILRSAVLQRGDAGRLCVCKAAERHPMQRSPVVPTRPPLSAGEAQPSAGAGTNHLTRWSVGWCSSTSPIRSWPFDITRRILPTVAWVRAKPPGDQASPVPEDRCRAHTSLRVLRVEQSSSSLDRLLPIVASHHACLWWTILRLD
jgi:hypothetical protein